MRVIHIIPTLRKGGAERLVIDIVRELSTRKTVSVALIVFNDIIEYDVSDIQDLIHIIPSRIELSLWRKNRYSVASLQAFIDNYQPDIIHSHLFEAEIVSRHCYCPNAKWFSHCHDNMVQAKRFSIKTLFDKKTITYFYERTILFDLYKKNGGTHFIAISKQVRQYFVLNAAPFHVTLLHNAIRYNTFYKPKQLTKERTNLKLINVGSLVDNKNQSFLLDVIKELKPHISNIHLYILGDGPNKSKLLEKSSLLNISEEISLVGKVDKVEEHLWAADVYVHSAKSEALGLTIIEAMAAGLPVVTLDGKGNRDLIEEDKNGYMVFDSNPKIFANKIIDLWNDKEKYSRISSYAQQFAKQFDIADYIDKLLALYR